MVTSSFIQRAYIAFFNRPADALGYNFWLNYVGPGQDILNQFAESAEYLSDFAGKGNREVIGIIYQNLFGRVPEKEGWDYWEAQMNAGWVTVGNAAYAILDGAQGADLDTINNKTTVAVDFTNALCTTLEIEAYAKAGDNGVGHLAKDWLATVSYDNGSLSTAQANMGEVLSTLVAANIYTPPPPPPPSYEVTKILSDAALQFIFPAACQYWIDVGVKEEQLNGIEFGTGSLVKYGWDVLAVTIGNQITFSRMGWSWSWFVDHTPFEHEEFYPGNAYTGFTALPGATAYGNMDLLTVFIHEIGHVIGLGHENLLGDYDVMAPYLEPGVRRLPTPANIASRMTGADSFTMDYMIELCTDNSDFASAYYGDTLSLTEVLDATQLIGYANLDHDLWGVADGNTIF